ncbi:NAD-dependent epimerase/dehydratase family protein [Citricoccus sp. SGAir0253]|uniref:NAD-dependent epimerase/dehydratase family protein n=1 Tax=Citricoccus sp. SGAir0253 TaxID=2567881 RepID=UPI0010CCFB1C|nr:NAD-dependent epimerase/dehydratase family protein [Citricoccus sp. SGAir0253]QCU76818.1 NAD-dependent epimerase/dehydratase family protein [Citricoccus sp. SGAir0253]
MKIAILGGDGFCGWPASLHLSDLGHEVIIVDNFSRRVIDEELGAQSLTPIRALSERRAAWKEVSGKEIGFAFLDVAQDYEGLVEFFRTEAPDAVVHFAEQRAAPYSMKSPRNKRYTVDNNVNATHNVLCAIVESGRDIHLVHLGTMGVYGYGTAGMKIPEGYLDVEVTAHEDAEGNPVEPHRIPQQILYPTNPGSIYHMTKVLDQHLFAYYVKNDSLRITDLHQGIIWGTHTEQTQRDERLINRFDYDGDYGTVLNRFLMQAAVGYPLTVHGTGGQTRAFIHMQDMVRCVQIALENPPAAGDRVKIFNQMTETHRVRDLAELVARITGAEVEMVPNPRNESAENELHVVNDAFLDLGLQPTTLSEGLLLEVEHIAERYRDRADLSKVPATSLWTARQQAGVPQHLPARPARGADGTATPAAPSAAAPVAPAEPAPVAQ